LLREAWEGGRLEALGEEYATLGETAEQDFDGWLRDAHG
jgi:hypothetical protein